MEGRRRTEARFEYFPQLPVELRRAIWKACIVPRVVVAARECPTSCTRTALRSQRKLPVIAEVCWEARKVARENYIWCENFGWWSEARAGDRLDREHEAWDHEAWYNAQHRVEFSESLWFNPCLDTVFLKQDSADRYFDVYLDEDWLPSSHLLLGDDGYECIQESNYLAFDHAGPLPYVINEMNPDASAFGLLPKDTGTFIHVAASWAIHPSSKDAAASEMEGLFEGDQKAVIVDITDTTRLNRFLRVYRQGPDSFPKIYGGYLPWGRGCDRDILEGIAKDPARHQQTRTYVLDSLQNDWLKFMNSQKRPLAEDGPFDHMVDERGIIDKDQPRAKEMLAEMPEVRVVFVFYLCEDEEHIQELRPGN